MSGAVSVSLYRMFKTSAPCRVVIVHHSIYSRPLCHVEDVRVSGFKIGKGLAACTVPSSFLHVYDAIFVATDDSTQLMIPSLGKCLRGHGVLEGRLVVTKIMKRYWHQTTILLEYYWQCKITDNDGVDRVQRLSLDADCNTNITSFANHTKYTKTRPKFWIYKNPPRSHVCHCKRPIFC